MTGFGSLVTRARLALVTGALAVGVLAAAAPASAQSSSSIPCGIPIVQPEAVFFFYEMQFEDVFPLDDEKACNKIVKQAVAVCHTATRESQQCLQELLLGMSKSGKVACHSDGGEGCLEEVLGELEGAKESLGEMADEAHESCNDEFASELFFACMNGFDPS
jgi:hypothetical protein